MKHYDIHLNTKQSFNIVLRSDKYPAYAVTLTSIPSTALVGGSVDIYITNIVDDNLEIRKLINGEVSMLIDQEFRDVFKHQFSSFDNRTVVLSDIEYLAKQVYSKVMDVIGMGVDARSILFSLTSLNENIAIDENVSGIQFSKDINIVNTLEIDANISRRLFEFGGTYLSGYNGVFLDELGFGGYVIYSYTSLDENIVIDENAVITQYKQVGEINTPTIISARSKDLVRVVIRKLSDFDGLYLNNYKSATLDKLGCIEI